MILQKYHASLLVQNNLTNSIIGTCIASGHMNLFISFLQQSMDLNLSRSHRTPTVEKSTKEKKAKKKDEDEEEKHELHQWHLVEEKNQREFNETTLIQSIIGLDWQGALSLILEDIDRFNLTDFQIIEAAVKQNKLNLVLRLFDRVNDSIIIKEKNAQQQNLYHLMANIIDADEHLYRDVLLNLHQNHLDWNVPDVFGCYPIHYACVKQNFVFVNFLQEHYSTKVNFKQTDASKNTALGLLFWSCGQKTSISETEICSLIKNGSDLDCLCNYNNETMVDSLSFDYISKKDDDDVYPSKDLKYRTSPLIHAILHQNFSLVKFLLELGVDVNYADGNKLTPLIHAVRKVTFSKNFSSNRVF